MLTPATAAAIQAGGYTLSFILYGAAVVALLAHVVVWLGRGV